MNLKSIESYENNEIQIQLKFHSKQLMKENCIEKMYPDIFRIFIALNFKKLKQENVQFSSISIHLILYKMYLDSILNHFHHL